MNITSRIFEKGVVIYIWLVFALFFSYWLSLVFANSPNIAGVENNVIYFVQRLLNNSSIYSDPENTPYAIAQYTPLYYYLVALIAKMLGVDANNITALFIINRAVSFALILCISLFVYFIGKNVFYFSNRKASLLFAVVFIFMEISSFARPDSLANASWFFSFLLLMLSLKNKKWNVLVLSALIATIAVFSKQSAFTLPLLVLTWFLVIGHYRFFIIYLLSFSVFMGVGLILINSVDGLWVFYMNVIKGIDNGISLTVYLNYIIQRFLFSQGLLWVIIMVPIVLILLKEKNLQQRLFVWMIVGQFAISCVSALKYGSSSNYFTEWWVLILIGIAYCWPYFLKAAQPVNVKAIYIMLMCILFFRSVTIFYPLYQEIFFKNGIQREQKYQAEQRVAQFLRTTASSKDFLVYNNIFSPDSYLNNFLFKEAVIPQNDIVVLGTYYRQVFDYSRFWKQIENGEIRFLILNTKEARAGFLVMDTINYKRLATIDNYLIFQHKKFVQ